MSTCYKKGFAVLTTANLPSKFWTYATATFVYIKNRSPHKYLGMSNSLTEWNIFNTGHSNIHLHDLRIFGSEAYVLDEKSLKNDPKAFRCIYLGPSSTHKGSNFYNLHTKKVITSRNFVINEQTFPGFEYWPGIYDKNFGTPPEVVEKQIPDGSPTPLPIDVQAPVPKTSTTIPETPATTTPAAIDSHPHIPTDIYVMPTDFDVTPQQSKPPTQAEVTQSTTHFNRSTLSQVGPADMPALDVPAPTVEDGEKHREEVEPAKVEPARADQRNKINAQPTYEVDAILDKRRSEFKFNGEERKSNAPWRKQYGYDYKVKWSTGEETWEPEEALDTAPDAVEQYESSVIHQQDTKVSTTETPSPSAEPAPEAFQLTNLCNYVHLRFFCFLTKLVSTNAASWKSIVVPETRSQMLASTERSQWIEAEKKELEQMKINKTWSRMKGRPPKKAITCRWVYKLKPPTSLNPTPTFKARLVAHGYKQKANIDYGSTFAQVATMKSFRIFIWLCVTQGLLLTQADFTSAFLVGLIDKEIYMTGPPGYTDVMGEVVRLRKSIYGLRQAPRIFYQTLIRFLNTLGFKELISDSCVLKHHTEKFYVLIFVDDLCLLTNNEKFRHKIELQLKGRFAIKILGNLKHFVGYQIDQRPDGSVLLHQKDYTQKILDNFAKYIPNNYKHSTPADSKIQFSSKQQPKTETERRKMTTYPYRQLIGSLLYILGTGPELYFVIIALSRFVNNPGWTHWLGAVYVLVYLKNTTNKGIHIQKKQELRLTVFVDADWGSNVDNRKSVSGYIIYLGSTPIVWRSKQQKGKPATSSCEAEYIALSMVISEVVWIITFMKELGYYLPLPITIYCDNKSAKDLAYNPVHHDRTKHIDISYHRIREFILDGTIIIVYVNTKDNPADLFTKIVTPAVFKQLIDAVYMYLYAKL